MNKASEMNSYDEAVSFMDLLDLDEEIIDKRLKSIMDKEKHSSKHLTNAIQLLKYKQLVNLQDNCDCENDDEWEFSAKLIKELKEENVDNVCCIVALTLELNSDSLVNKSEHLLQQILADIELPTDVRDGADTPEQNTALWNFKILDCILDTLIKKGEKLNLPFLELPVKSILHSTDEKLKVHFLTNSVPKLFEGISGFSILDKIWEHIKDLQEDKREVALNVLSALSEYYLPVADSKGNILFKSTIIYQYEFWNNIFHGLLSNDPTLRKISVYLAKRAVDCVMVLNKSVSVKSDDRTIFTWDHTNKKNEKILWDNFFILIDSLEEKQSNIVLPSLQLFGSLKSLGNWLNCAFNIGLRHDNTQVRLKCIQNRLDIKINSQSEALVLLEALNDINLFDNVIECDDLKKKICTFISDIDVFIHVFAIMPTVKWSPVPFYHITGILSEMKFKDLISDKRINISASLIDILKVSCNNILIRKAVYVNITIFVINCCVGLHWKDILSIFCILQTEITPDNYYLEKLVTLLISVRNEEKQSFFKVVLDSHLLIDFGLLYLKNHPPDVNVFVDLLLEKIKKLDELVSRQYSDKSEHLNDLIHLIQLYMKSNKASYPTSEILKVMIAGAYKIILYFILSLLSNNTLLSIDEMNMLSNGFRCMYTTADSPEVVEILLQLYKASLLFIKDEDTALETKVLSMYLINNLMTNEILLSNYRHEMLSLKDVITLTVNFENKQSIGRLRNVYYEKSCEIVDTLMKNQESDKDRQVKDIAEFIENVIECGGYGCLRACLKIMNAILPSLLDNETIKFDISQFIHRMWKEIEELKSNNQYNPCIEEFVNLITNDALLSRSMYNNVVISYCNKIIENGSVKTAPLFYLVNNLNSKEFTPDHGQLIYVLCEILLYSPVPRKDQRIVENLVVGILHDKKYGSNSQNTDIHFNFQIQYLSISILTKIMNKNILSNIEMFIKNRIDEVFKNKQRYHGHSQAHRLLLTALQHLLLLSALKSEKTDAIVKWSIELLGRLPHQPSVRICLEWYIAMQFYIKQKHITQELIEEIKYIPMTSQFLILYWIIRHKINEGACPNEEYEFVMDVLLSHTMGQMFNIRLHAQYLATKLHNINKNASVKYSYTIKVIENTFIESAKDKNFTKLQQDYFVNTFDVINDFTPSFIYYFLPRYCEINNNEFVDLTFVQDIMKNITLNVGNHDFFKNEKCNLKSDEEVFSMKTWKDVKSKVVDDVEELGTIQKKYVPWKNMSDVNMCETGKKKKSSSELIVVASLIDKLPNLGGMARTSEVFGVKTYVVDSLRHLQDKQFQGLSVSAERWIDVEEVRPGQPLKQYVLQKKSEGYSVVAAEQTSTSAKLQSFKFPKKTLLLLGHEKEGIPCDLLPMMDHCVEIPQQGFVRSLNVHVTAAIFVWEYARKNIL